jgi:hypothetical protein
MISVSLDANVDVYPTVVRALTLIREPYDGTSVVSWTHLVALSIHLDRLAISLEAVADPADPGALDPEGTPRWWRVALRDDPERLVWYYGKLPLTAAESILDGSHLKNEVRRVQVDLEAIDTALISYGIQHWGEAWMDAHAQRPPPYGVDAMLTVQWPEFPQVLDQGQVFVDLPAEPAQEN